MNEHVELGKFYFRVKQDIKNYRQLRRDLAGSEKPCKIYVDTDRGLKKL